MLFSPFLVPFVAAFLGGCTGLSSTPSNENFQQTRNELSIFSNTQASSSRKQNGSLLIARPAPVITTPTIMYAQNNLDCQGDNCHDVKLLGFTPESIEAVAKLSGVRGQRVATINRSVKEIDFNSSNQDKITTNIIRSDDNLTKGLYKVSLIQAGSKRNMPRWYAPDSYYEKRKLPIPPTGSAPRFLKGALGVGAVFLQPLVFFSENHGAENNGINNELISSTDNKTDRFNQGVPLHCSKEYTEDVGGIQVSERVFQLITNRFRNGDTILLK
jgi:hypothetical protein